MATDDSKATESPRLPRGAYSKIARRMRPQVTPQFVRMVHLRQAKSARVSAAIERFRASLVDAKQAS